MEIVMKRLEELRPYEKNPRHNEDAVIPVVNSIKNFGFRVPIVVDDRDVIIAGHTRYLAAKYLGMERVPCVVADDLTPDEARAFRLADKLKPKIVVAENVVGLLGGKSRGYVNEIIKAFDNAGYEVQIFRLNAAQMGVPQKRERVFFIGRRKDLKLPKLELRFDEEPILFGTVRSAVGRPLNPETVTAKMLSRRKAGDNYLWKINSRSRGVAGYKSSFITADAGVSNTLMASDFSCYRMADGMAYSDEDCRNVQTFPQDYDFGKASVQYVCGMSVPPVMMAQIAAKIHEQWLRG